MTFQLSIPFFHTRQAMVATFLILLSAAPTQAQSKLTCATYFQARADWLRGLGGPAETAEMMERHAELLWLSEPKDCGMSTGLGTTSCTYAPDRMAVEALLSTWANEGQGLEPRPLCMNDAACIRCTDLVREVSR